MVQAETREEQSSLKMVERKRRFESDNKNDRKETSGEKHMRQRRMDRGQSRGRRTDTTETLAHPSHRSVLPVLI